MCRSIKSVFAMYSSAANAEVFFWKLALDHDAHAAGAEPRCAPIVIGGARAGHLRIDTREKETSSQDIE